MKHHNQNSVVLILAVILLILVITSLLTAGPVKLLAGLQSGAASLLRVIPLILAAFIFAGLIQTLIPPQIIDNWLSAQSGLKGILLASLSGAVIPGAPYIIYPVAAGLLKSGAGLGVLIAFVSATSFWSLINMPIEFALLGTRLATARIALTLVVPPLLGVLAEAIFGHHIDRIRQTAP